MKNILNKLNNSLKQKKVAIEALINRSKMRYNAFMEYEESMSAINKLKRDMKRDIDMRWRQYELEAMKRLYKDLSKIN